MYSQTVGTVVFWVCLNIGSSFGTYYKKDTEELFSGYFPLTFEH